MFFQQQNELKKTQHDLKSPISSLECYLLHKFAEKPSLGWYKDKNRSVLFTKKVGQKSANLRFI